ncbi:MAG: hypothetical protein CMF48_01895 [Legionellales bacterium]|nr:hypothetical protein [Legionellales bacterium]|tara:strand:- start:126 stop:632 length:507 start_codon:yes stop_codon:yes gene_type:complete
MLDRDNDLLSLLTDTIWVPNQKNPVPSPDIQPSREVIKDKAQRFDSLHLLKDVTSAKILWILAEKSDFERMAENPKSLLRSLLKSVRFSNKDIVPGLVMNSNDALTDTQATEELRDQCEALNPEFIISHVSLELENLITLPTAAQLASNDTSRQEAYDFLKKSGLLLD